MVAGTVHAPTCTEEGYTEYACTRCDKTDIGDIKAATGHTEVIDAAVPATCTATGKTEGKHCSVCNEILVAQTEIAALGHSDYRYTDNGDGTHKVTCGVCGDTITASEAHVYVDGTCPCGAKEATEPEMVLDNNLTFMMNITVGAEMQVVYTVMKNKVSTFDSFYLEVEKDVAGGETVVTRYEIGGTPALAPVSAGSNVVAYRATYTGINAKEMCDEFRATLYAVGSDGVIHYSATNANSIKSFLTSIINNTTAIAAQKTMAVDMLNYGAAAQTYLGYDTDNLANADLTPEQAALGTQTIPEAVNHITSNGTGLAMNTNVQVKSKVILTLTCMYGTASENVKLVVTDHADGSVKAEIPLASKTAGTRVYYQGSFDDVGARAMRTLYDFTVYDGDTAVSKTVTWSVESYVAYMRSTASDANQIALFNAILIYGDAVAAYLTASGQ